MLRYYVPSVSSATSSSDRYFRADPLPQTYDEIPTEFEVDVAEDSDFGEMMGEIDEGDLEEDFDDGPPILDRQEEEYVPEAFTSNWIENEIEVRKLFAFWPKLAHFTSFRSPAPRWKSSRTDS